MEWSGVGWSGVEWSGVEWSGVERSGVEEVGGEGIARRGLFGPLHGSPVSGPAGARALIKLQISRICVRTFFKGSFHFKLFESDSLHFHCDNSDLLMHVISRHQLPNT